MVSEANGHFRQTRRSLRVGSTSVIVSEHFANEYVREAADVRRPGARGQGCPRHGLNQWHRLGIARALAWGGADIVLNGLGVAAELDRTREQIAAEFGVKASFSPADMTRPNSIVEMIAATVAQAGRLDILINNAGIQHVAPLEQFPVEKWDQILAINLSSAFHTTRLALPAMRQNGFGRIINIASAHGLVGSPFKAAYVAAKHGIVGLTKVTALETAEEGITCNAICPGYVYTPLVEAQIDGQAKAHGI